jgi:hypothetical protein
MKIEEIKTYIKNNILYKNWEFVVGDKNGVPYVQIQFDAPDNFNPHVLSRQYCRKWQLSEFMTETEIVRTCFLAVKQAETHELEENFLFKGNAIFNSHIHVKHLNSLFSSEMTELFDYRTTKA